MRNDLLEAATRIGLGFTPSELITLRQEVDNSVSAAGAKLSATLKSSASSAIVAITHQANEAITQASAKAGKAGKDAAEKAVWKAALIAGGIGIVGGGLLGFALSRKFR